MSGVASGPILQLRQIEKRFGDFTAVTGVDLDIAEGEFFTLVGPSGSGKTTMIRMLVGMERPTGGDILLRGQRCFPTSRWERTSTSL
jgi:spermidine/putrescine transport system ATP-binding protein